MRRIRDNLETAQLEAVAFAIRFGNRQPPPPPLLLSVALLLSILNLRGGV